MTASYREIEIEGLSIGYSAASCESSGERRSKGKRCVRV